MIGLIKRGELLKRSLLVIRKQSCYNVNIAGENKVQSDVPSLESRRRN